MTRTPLLTLAALTISGSIVFAQAPPAPSPGAGPQAAPVERRPPSDSGMDRGMQGRGGGPSNFHHAGDRVPRGGDSSFHGRPSGFHGRTGGDFRGPQGGGMMGGSFRIAPPGMWWRNPGTIQKLTLTPEQTKKMDDIFQASRISLVDLKATVEKQELMLEPMLSANPPDTAKTLLQIDKVAQARANLEKENARMLLGIRGVLTPDQWTKLRAGGPGGFGRSSDSGRAATPGGAAGGGGASGYGRGHGPGGQGAGGGSFAAPNPQP